MKKGVQIIAFFMLLYSCRPQVAQQGQQLTVRQMQSDYDSLRSALEEAHGGLCRYSSKDEMNQTFERYRSQLDHPMTTLQFASVIAGLLPELRDGHLRLALDSSTTANLASAKLLPLRIIAEHEKLRVLFNDTPDDRLIQPGTELTSINGHTSIDLFKLFVSKLSGDGFIETAKRKRAAGSFGVLYWLLIDDDSVFSVTTKDKNGKTVTATLNGVLTADRARNGAANPVNSVINKTMKALEGPEENISIRFISEGIAVLRIRSFTGGNFYNEIDTVFRQVRDRKATSMILDLRGNGGGSDYYGAYLVAQFMQRPFRYFDHIRMRTVNPSFTKLRSEVLNDLRTGTVVDSNGSYLLTAQIHNGVGEQAPGKTPFTGKLVVLEDGGTFSTAADVAAVLRNLTTALFIGEESGGSYDGNTSGATARFTFPNSKFTLNVTMYDYYNAVKPAKNKGRGTMPDFPVTLTTSDLLKGIDGQWEKALQVATENK
jgi:C-terminal processing protease CtpA/Prc